MRRAKSALAALQRTAEERQGSGSVANFKKTLSQIVHGVEGMQVLCAEHTLLTLKRPEIQGQGPSRVPKRRKAAR